MEDAEIHDGSLDTVANQIVGLVMDFGDLSAMRAYDIVTRAYPFRDLSEGQFKDVCRELKGNRLVWLDEQNDRLETSSQTSLLPLSSRQTSLNWPSERSRKG